MKRAIILILTAAVLITLMAVGAAAAPKEPYYPFYNYYQHVPVYIRLNELPKTIKGQFDYDRDFIDVYPSYPGYEDKGFLFPLTDEKYGAFYNVRYTVNDTVITYEYTLKNNVSLEDFENKNSSQTAIKDGEPLYYFPLFDIAMKLKVTLPPAKIVDHKILDLETVVGTTVYRNGEMLGTCYGQYLIFPLENLDYVPPTETPMPYMLTRLLEQYDLSIYALTEYDEIYEHTDENGEVDWAIVKAATEIQKTHGYTAPCYYEFGNRVLETDCEGKPFDFDIGVFSVKDDRFYDLIEPEIYELEDIERVWTESGEGRLMGDMNGDNELDVTDAVLIQRCQLKLAEYPADDKNHPIDMVTNPIGYFSDFNQDGERDILDAAAIQRFLIRLPYRPEGWIPFPHISPTEPTAAPTERPTIYLPEEPTAPMLPVYSQPTTAPSAPTQPTETLPTEIQPTEVQPTEAEVTSEIPRITGFKSTGKGVELSLSTVRGAEKYRVYHKDAGGGWIKLGETSTDTFTDTDVEVGKTHTYTVRCIKADLSEFTSDFDSTGWTYTYEPKLDTPRITGAEAVSNGVTLSWAPIDGADLYRVYSKRDGKWTRLGDTRDTSFFDNSTKWNYYTYTVRCLSAGGRDFASDYDSEGYSFRVYEEPYIANLTVRQDRISFKVSADHCPRIRIYRKTGDSGWNRIAEIDGKITSNRQFDDYDVTPGETYTYTARVVDENGNFLSRFNTSGWKQIYSMAYCVPELEYAVYLGDDVLLVQPKINDNFHIKKFKMDIYYGGSHENTVYITDEPCYVRYNMPIYPGNNYIDLTLDLVGIDDSGKHITGVSAITDPSFTLLTPVKNVSIEKTGDRRYKISWDKVANSPGYALNMYTEGSEQPAIIGDFIHTDSYEVDLSGQPRDAVWSCRIWARSHNARSVSLPTLFEFRESDYEQ